MRTPRRTAGSACFLILVATAAAALRLGSPFGDHMVLQRDQPVPVWGWADAGDHVTVEFAGQRKRTQADAAGAWRVTLDALPANAEPREFVVTAGPASDGNAESRKLADVLVGEVWLCGGQSNMERQLGPRPPQQPLLNWEREAASANTPQIRQLYVRQHTATSPQPTAEMAWSVCSPATAPEFTAVGYYLARDLHAARRVPVGIIHSSWGGTPAEAWTSLDGLAAFPEFAETLSVLRTAGANPTEARRLQSERLEQWYRLHDPGSGTPLWADPALDTLDWERLPVPAKWEEAGHDGFDGLVWLRRTFDLPDSWHGTDVELRLGAIDDIDTTWVNGQLVGNTSQWNTPRIYRVPASVLKPRGNVIAVRVLDTGGHGGIWDSSLPCEIAGADGSFVPVPLGGPWLARFALELQADNRPPQDVTNSAGAPTVLFNGMIAPLVPYAIRGVAFYQGEANVGRERQYRTLLPAMIADWRRQWNAGDFPFLFVQIAPHFQMSPEIREAQLLAWQATKNTALVVTIDVGDAQDIHPANKEPVGARLALAARALAYGEELEYSGPVFSAMRVTGQRAVLSFTHVGGGLVSKDGRLTGFTIAGVDGVFHPATAEFDGDTVVVSSATVAQPRAVRYGWANVAFGNLFNRAGLPASPFRTDVE